MTGIITQVSISNGGVPKYAVDRGEIAKGGIAGDRWRHPKIHGIPKRAILLLTEESLEEIQSMGFSVRPGALGENLTTRGLDRRALRFGQRFRCGSASIQLTELRVPCNTLIRAYGKDIDRALLDAAAVRGDPASPVWGLSGFYASVLEPGPVRPGDSMTLID